MAAEGERLQRSLRLHPATTSTHDYMVGIKGLTNLIWVWDVQDLDFNWAPYNPGDSHRDVLAMDMYGGDGYTTQKYQTILQLTGISGNAVQQIQDLYNAANVITLDQMPGWS